MLARFWQFFRPIFQFFVFIWLLEKVLVCFVADPNLLLLIIE